MTYPFGFTGAIEIPRSGVRIEPVMQIAARVIELENGWIVSREVERVDFTGRPWNLRHALRSLTAATSGFVRVGEADGSLRVEFQVRLTSILLLSAVGAVWFAVPITFFDLISIQGGIGIGGLVFLIATGSVHLLSSFRFRSVLAAALDA
jgi:hypothetical protein